MKNFHYEIIKACRYYKNKAPGWVALINGQPHHVQTKTEAFEFVDHLLKISREGGNTMTIDTLFGKETVSSKPRTIKFKQIKAVFETLTVSEDIMDYLKTGQRYTAPAQVSDTFQFLMKETKEMFITLHLDGKNRIICLDVVSIGSLNQSIVHPRSVFMTACLSSAAAILCIHNHPSGDPTPSSEDIAITRRLKEAGEIMGIKLLDHIIVGDGEYLSFVERGLL